MSMIANLRRVFLTPRNVIYAINNYTDPDERINQDRIVGLPISSDQVTQVTYYGEILCHEVGTRLEFPAPFLMHNSYAIIAIGEDPDGNQIIPRLGTYSGGPMGGTRDADYIYIYPGVDNTLVRYIVTGVPA